VALAEAIKEIMDARGLRPADVARRLGGEYDRTTFYGVLKGATTQPRLGTLVVLCRALELSPTELLQLAGLWPYRERSVDTLDRQLRTAFAQLRILPFDDKQRAVAIVTCLAAVWAPQHEHAAAPANGPTENRHGQD
jgi:transcriptional regulator with XRE-family HTH domain